MNGFFEHFYNGQWKYRILYDMTQNKDEEGSVWPHPDETIQDVMRDENGRICAVRVPLYSRDGVKLVYDGFWSNRMLNGEGMLFLEIWHRSVLEELKAEKYQLEIRMRRIEAKEREVKERRNWQKGELERLMNEITMLKNKMADMLKLPVEKLEDLKTEKLKQEKMERDQAIDEEKRRIEESINRVSREGIDYYKGSFVDNERTGHGTEWNGENKLVYDGEFKNGVRNGKGISYWPNGSKEYEGNWENGLKKDSDGKEYDSNGFLSYAGGVKNGVIWTKIAPEQRVDEGFVYLAPTCCQMVKNYGSNSMEGVMYYHHCTGCDLEKVVFGQPCHPQYEEREVAFAQNLAACVTKPVCYICFSERGE